MNKILEKYKQSFPIILIIIYAIGYVYLFQYYSRFNIEIEYYINLTDIIFFTIKNIFFLLFVYIIFEIVLRIVSYILLYFAYHIKYWIFSKSRKKPNDENTKELDIKNIIDIGISKYISDTTISICIISTFIFLYYEKEYLIPLSIVCPYLLTKAFMPKLLDKEKSKKVTYFYPVLILLLIFAFGIFGYKDGDLVKKRGTLNRVEYSIDSKIYSSDSIPILIIGETSSYLFVYDKKIHKTTIISKEKLDYIRIEDPAIIEEKNRKETEIKTQKDIKKIQNFFDKIKEKNKENVQCQPIY